MNALRKINVVYAYDTPYGHGPTYETLAEALEQQDTIDSGARLFKVYVDPDGKVVHAVELP